MKDLKLNTKHNLVLTYKAQLLTKYATYYLDVFLDMSDYQLHTN